MGTQLREPVIRASTGVVGATQQPFFGAAPININNMATKMEPEGVSSLPTNVMNESND